uniref:Uncharacterized protein n=1 Tax=Magallana gigas TaxID=29159 RepID=K1QCS3_MAGGI
MEGTEERSILAIGKVGLTATNKTNWTEKKRISVRTFLNTKQAYTYISSDEEGVDGFLSHSYSWESDTWKHVKKPRYQVSRDMSTKIFYGDREFVWICIGRVQYEPGEGMLA